MAEKKDKQENDNLRFYNQLKAVPDHAIKEIQAGRLKGMSDINPLFRIKAMTEVFGPCGIGWKYEITKQWQETYGQEVKSFTNINLYIKVNGEWSDPIPGTGGSTIVEINSKGSYVNDECVDGDCEVLTPNGWVKFRNYNGIDDVCQFECEGNKLSFVKPLAFVHKLSDNVIDKGGVIMTENHRHLCFNIRKRKFVEKFANELTKLIYIKSKNGYGRSNCFQDIKCGYLGNREFLSTLQRIGIMIACDGTKYRETQNKKIFWRCEFSKKRKIERAEALLRSYGVSYKKDTNNERQTTSFIFSLGNDVNYKTYKSFLPYANYGDLWDNIIFWDGCAKDHESFSTSNKNNALYLQTLLTISGCVVSIYLSTERGVNKSDLYTLYKKKHNTSMSGAKKIDGNHEMYCVTVPSSYFLLRKGTDMLVTGNCYKMSLTDALSVAMKSLGVAADVYYSKDKQFFDSKYMPTEQNTQATQGNTGSVAPAVLTEIQNATDLTALTAIWNKYPQYQKDSQFTGAMTARKDQIKNNGKK